MIYCKYRRKISISQIDIKKGFIEGMYNLNALRGHLYFLGG